MIRISESELLDLVISIIVACKHDPDRALKMLEDYDFEESERLENFVNSFNHDW